MNNYLIRKNENILIKNKIQLLSNGCLKVNGIYKKAVEFITQNQLKNRELWSKLVHQFRLRNDSIDNGWKGEFWGKQMRGASIIYRLTNDKVLYNIMVETVNDLLSTIDKNGIIKSYSYENELCGWDLWCRKYIILGLEYFIDICEDSDLVEKIVDFLQVEADYLLDRIGNGKINITDTSNVYGGLNSCSILEPIVKLYEFTSNAKYLDFAEYIISTGGSKECNLYELAYQAKVMPYEYPVKKAYEMFSFFEGLLEYYRITGKEKYLIAVENFTNMISLSDLSIIGCSGSNEELLNNSSKNQTEYNQLMQETCVTVTWIKLCMKLYLVTGKSKYSEFIENSGYNALFASINFNNNQDLMYKFDDLNVRFLPIDSYSPLCMGRRGVCIGGYRRLDENTSYGCCISIVSAGIGIVPLSSICSCEDGLIINILDDIQGNYVKDDEKITFSIKAEENNYLIKFNNKKSILFDLKIRVASWLDVEQIVVDNKKIDYEIKDGYIVINKKWQNGSFVRVFYKEKIQEVKLNDKTAIKLGRYVLARDERFNEKIDEKVILCHDDKNVLIFEKTKDANFNTIKELSMKCNDNKIIHLCDYISAGTNWDSQKKLLTVWF